ncbi:hypothetical protein [Nocardia heshunensis]
MGSFSIVFSDPDSDREAAMAVGVIRLGEFAEYFRAPIGYWGLDEYRASWVAGLERTVDGESVSCLAVAMGDPKTTNFVEVWPLYRDGDVVHVQNRLIFLDQLDHDLDPARPWGSLGERATVGEDGTAISEWTVSMADIEGFLDSIR